MSNKERDISITLNFIKWLEKRTAENNKRIELFDALRCTSNKNFIGDAKNNRKTTQLVSFLKNAIENASGVRSLLNLRVISLPSCKRRSSPST